MAEEAWRILLVGGVAVLALVSAAVATRWRTGRIERSALGPDDLPDRVNLFSSSSCPSCDRARSALGRTGVGFREVRYETEPELHLRAGVAAVPLLVIRDRSGRIVARIAGAPSRRRLRKALRRGGLVAE